MRFQVFEQIRDLIKDPPPWGSVKVWFNYKGTVDAESTGDALEKARDRYPKLYHRIAVAAEETLVEH